MKATHYYKDDIDFYESEYVVEDGKITYYRIVGKGCVWRKPNPNEKRERFPKVEDLKEISDVT